MLFENLGVGLKLLKQFLICQDSCNNGWVIALGFLNLLSWPLCKATVILTKSSCSLYILYYIYLHIPNSFHLLLITKLSLLRLWFIFYYRRYLNKLFLFDISFKVDRFLFQQGRKEIQFLNERPLFYHKSIARCPCDPCRLHHAFSQPLRLTGSKGNSIALISTTYCFSHLPLNNPNQS